MRFSPGCSCCGVGLVCDIVPCTVPSRLLATVTATAAPGPFPIGAVFAFDYDSSLGCWSAPAPGLCGGNCYSHLRLVVGCGGTNFFAVILWNVNGSPNMCGLDTSFCMQNATGHASTTTCAPPYTIVSQLGSLGPGFCGESFGDQVTFNVVAG